MRLGLFVDEHGSADDEPGDGDDGDDGDEHDEEDGEAEAVEEGLSAEEEACVQVAEGESSVEGGLRAVADAVASSENQGGEELDGDGEEESGEIEGDGADEGAEGVDDAGQRVARVCGEGEPRVGGPSVAAALEVADHGGEEGAADALVERPEQDGQEEEQDAERQPPGQRGEAAGKPFGEGAAEARDAFGEAFEERLGQPVEESGVGGQDDGHGREGVEPEAWLVQEGGDAVQGEADAQEEVAGDGGAAAHGVVRSWVFGGDEARTGCCGGVVGVWGGEARTGRPLWMMGRPVVWGWVWLPPSCRADVCGVARRGCGGSGGRRRQAMASSTVMTFSSGAKRLMTALV